MAEVALLMVWYWACPECGKPYRGWTERQCFTVSMEHWAIEHGTIDILQEMTWDDQAYKRIWAFHITRGTDIHSAMAGQLTSVRD